MGYLICRRCGARIDLPHVKHSRQVPPFFLAKCNKCGGKEVYSYVDLKDVEIPTMEEYLQQPEGRLLLLLRLLPDFMMFTYGIMQAQEGIAHTLRRILEERERRSLQL